MDQSRPVGTLVVPTGLGPYRLACRLTCWRTVSVRDEEGWQDWSRLFARPLHRSSGARPRCLYMELGKRFSGNAGNARYCRIRTARRWRYTANPNSRSSSRTPSVPPSPQRLVACLEAPTGCSHRL